MPANEPKPTVTMLSPNGESGEIPVDRVDDAAKAGFQRAVRMTAPDGSTGVVPVDRASEAQKAGYRQTNPVVSEDMQPNYAAMALDHSPSGADPQNPANANLNAVPPEARGEVNDRLLKGAIGETGGYVAPAALEAAGGLLGKIPGVPWLATQAVRGIEGVPFLGKYAAMSEDAPSLGSAMTRGAIGGGTLGAIEGSGRAAFGKRPWRDVPRDALYGAGIGAGLSGGFYGLGRLAPDAAEELPLGKIPSRGEIDREPVAEERSLVKTPEEVRQEEREYELAKREAHRVGMRHAAYGKRGVLGRIEGAQ